MPFESATSLRESDADRRAGDGAAVVDDGDLESEHGVFVDRRGGEAGDGVTDHAQGHGRAGGLLPDVGDDLSVGIAGGRAVERDRGTLFDGLGTAGAGGGRRIRRNTRVRYGAAGGPEVIAGAVGLGPCEPRVYPYFVTTTLIVSLPIAPLLSVSVS